MREEGTNSGDRGHASSPKEEAREELGMKLYPTGSTLPDCSHACGPCFPCKRVMISYKCSVESCPIVYRCMCKGKYYHVPASN
ncbi:Protein EPIDERMAL PATTERNING FACTOR 2 [Morella rubra]|nr:Protein EPIDERMAL PATTERNING FACTOR 2 [Morella rubra]